MGNRTAGLEQLGAIIGSVPESEISTITVIET